MVMEELKSKLPKVDEQIKNIFSSCSKRKKFLETENSESILHLEKAKHDLQRAIKEFEDNCWDWTIIKAYYSIHHAGNALLIKKQGLFSKDHFCLIIALKYINLISDLFYQELKKTYSNFSNFTAFELTYSLRKISQYDVVGWKKVNRRDAELILTFAKKFITFVEREI
jgi:uncharacterized protein (UPF0332 family)